MRRAWRHMWKGFFEGVQRRLEAKTIKHVSLRFSNFAGTIIPHLVTCVLVFLEKKYDLLQEISFLVWYSWCGIIQWINTSRKYSWPCLLNYVLSWIWQLKFCHQLEVILSLLLANAWAILLHVWFKLAGLTVSL